MKNKIFTEKLKTINALAKELAENTKNADNFAEYEDKALEISKMLDALYQEAKGKQVKQLSVIYYTLEKCGLYYACFKDKLLERLHLGDKRYKKLWLGYIEFLLTMYSYRIFNLDILRPAAMMYLASQKKFSEKNISHRLMVSNVVWMNDNNQEYHNYFIDDTYHEIYAKPFMEFIKMPLKEELRGKRLMLGVKIPSKEEKNRQDFDYFINCPNFEYKIVIDDSKVNYKLPKEIKKEVINFDLDAYFADKETRDHDYLISELKKEPSALTLLEYLISVYNGNPHYTYLKPVIDIAINDVLFRLYDYDIDNGYPYRTKLSGDFIKPLCQYFMMYVNIIPSSKHKAYEFLFLNLKKILAHPTQLKKFLSYLPKKMQATLTCYLNDIDLDNDYKTLFMQANPLCLNQKELKAYLANTSDEETYQVLNLFKKENKLIFDAIIGDYQAIYQNQDALEAERKAQALEQERLLAEQQRLEEEEKRRQAEEEQRILEKREKLKEAIHKEKQVLTEQELDELIFKTDDIDAMNKVASHYFDLGSQQPSYYQLACKYYKIVGALGSNYGYYNVAISLHNIAIHYEKDSEEYNNAFKEAFEVIKNAPLFFMSYCLYALYSMDVKFPIDTNYLEDNYQVLLNDEKMNERAKKYVKASYEFYKNNFYSSVSYFNEIRDYASPAVISVYVTRFAMKFNESFRKQRAPETPQGFINPFSKEYDEYHRKMLIYQDYVSTAAKTRNLIDWACDLKESRSIKYKASCLYYGSLNYEKNHEEALRLLNPFKDNFELNDKDYKEIYDKLIAEFGKDVKKILAK